MNSNARLASDQSEGRPPLLTPAYVQLWLFNFIAFLAALQLFPTIPFRIMDLGGTKSQAGLFLAFYTYASACSAPLMGAIADSIGRRRQVIISAAAFVVFSLLYGFISQIPILLLVAALHGVFWSGLLASSGALIADVIPESRRTEGLAYWGMAPTLAVAVAPPVGLWFYGMSFQSVGWSMAIMSTILFFVGLRLPSDQGRHAAHVSLPPISRMVDWRVVVHALTLYVVSFGYGGITSYVAVMADERSLMPRSLYFTILAVTILVSRFLLAPLGDRFGPLKLLFPSLIAVPPALLFLSMAHSYPPLVVSAVLFGIGIGGSYPSFMTTVLNRTDPLRRAATFGAILFAFDIGLGSGSLVTGLFIDRYGFDAAFLFAALLSLAAVPIFLSTSSLLGSARLEVAKASD